MKPEIGAHFIIMIFFPTALMGLFFVFFVNLVLQKLEEENAEFFKAYYIRLKLKNQIVLYNHLLEQQYHLMKDQVPPEVPLPCMQNGMHYMPGISFL